MQNRGLLFIPDISGFSRFVTETEIGHSRLIIQELLETLINANEMGLEISEIEGDAILFYRFGEPPTLQDLYRQVEKMFCDFHRCLIAYDSFKYCQCDACTSANTLTLKIITHYGEFTGYHVKNFNKLIGKDLITAHQLLKNNIQQHEYWLVTHNVSDDAALKGLAQWMTWSESAQQTETGKVSFYYTQLGQLKNKIKPDPGPQLALEKKEKMISLQQVYDTDLITMFHGAGDFRYRPQWQEGVKFVDEVHHFLPRVGMKCRCVLDSGEMYLYSNSYNFNDTRIEFSETDQNENTFYYTLERIGRKKIKLTLDYYVKKGGLSKLIFRLAEKRKLEDKLRRSLASLDGLVKQLKIPSALDE